MPKNYKPPIPPDPDKMCEDCRYKYYHTCNIDWTDTDPKGTCDNWKQKSEIINERTKNGKA